MSEEHEQRWSAETDRVLRRAGWYPGRSVCTAEWENTLREHGGFEMHEAARRFLAEFGGLESTERGPGKAGRGHPIEGRGGAADQLLDAERFPPFVPLLCHSGWEL
jgi:hypothetical protein